MKNVGIKKLTHETLGKDSWDKTILLLAFILGIVGNIILKLLPIPIIIPALFSALVIIGYVVWTYRSEDARLEPEQIGDNAYYLGFILTLSSLSYTLYSISSSRGEADFIADVISGFGIALSSTIVGVAMRVYMQQFRLDLVARDQEARLAINQAMREFRTELSDSVRGMKLFGVELRQSLDEHHDKLAKSQEARLNKSLEEMVKSFDNVVAEFSKQSQKSHGEITDHAKKTLNVFYEDTSNVLGRLEKSLSSTGEKVEEAMLSIGSSITDQVEVNNTNFSKISDSILSSNQNVVLAISEFDSTISDAVSNINRNVGTTSSQAEEASSILSKTSTQIDSAVKSAIESVNSLVMMNNKQLQSASDLFESKENHDTKVASELNNAIAHLTSEVTKLSSEYHNLHDSIGSISGDFRSIANELSKQVDSIRKGQLETLSKLDKFKDEEFSSKSEHTTDSAPISESSRDVDLNQPGNVDDNDDSSELVGVGQEPVEGDNATPQMKSAKRFQNLFRR